MAHTPTSSAALGSCSRQEGTDFYRELYKVVQRAELSRSEFGISGKVTRLTLQGEFHDFGSPRQVTVMAVADPVYPDRGARRARRSTRRRSW